MQSRRFIFFFKIWAVVFATTLYFAQAIIAQSPEQRLIHLLVISPLDAELAETEAGGTTSTSQARLCRLRTSSKRR